MVSSIFIAYFDVLGFKTIFGMTNGWSGTGKEKWPDPKDGLTKISRNFTMSGDHNGSGTSVSELLLLGQLLLS